MARLVEVAEAKLFVEERGEPTVFPLVVFHGGPGLDHTIGDYLDLLTEGGGYRLVLADERACGRSDRTVPRETWTLGQMAQDVSHLAASLGVAGGYATLGHSYGVIVVMQHAVDHPGARAARSCRWASRRPGGCSPRHLPGRLGRPLEPPSSSAARGVVRAVRRRWPAGRPRRWAGTARRSPWIGGNSLWQANAGIAGDIGTDRRPWPDRDLYRRAPGENRSCHDGEHVIAWPEPDGEVAVGTGPPGGDQIATCQAGT
jgi:hypothetical protein